MGFNGYKGHYSFAFRSGAIAYRMAPHFGQQQWSSGRDCGMEPERDLTPTKLGSTTQT